MALIVGNIGVDLTDVGDHRAKVDRCKARLSRAGFDLGNPEQGVKGSIDLIALGSRLVEKLGDLLILTLQLCRFVEN